MNRRTASLLGGRRAGSDLADAADRGLVTGPESALVARLAAARSALEQRTDLPEQTRQAQRARLVAVATVHPPTTDTGRAASPLAATPTRRRIVVALASVIGLTGLSGVAAAASLSLPGDPFYDVKRGQESVELALSFNDRAKGEQYLEMATTRLLEVRGLVKGRDALDASFIQPGGSVAPTTPEQLDRVASTLLAMDVSTRSGTTLLTDLWRQGDDAVPLRTVELWAQSQGSQLNALLPRLGSSGRGQAEVTLALLQAVNEQAGELRAAGPCPGGCDPGARASQTPSDPARPTDVRPTADPGTAPTPRSGPAAPTPTSPPTTASPPTPPSPGPTSAPATTPSPAGSPARPNVRPPTDPPVPSVVPDVPGLPAAPLPSVPLPDVPLPPDPLPDVPLPDGTIIPLPSLPERDSILLPSVTPLTGTPSLPGAG